MRLSEKSLKKDAKRLKKNTPELTLHEALDAVARRHGYQRWKNIKPLLAQLREDMQLKKILDRRDIHKLIDAYSDYQNGKINSSKGAFFILCHLSKVVADAALNANLVARFHHDLYGIGSDDQRLLGLSALQLYIATNLGWHQVRGIGCPADLENAEYCFLLATQQSNKCIIPYGNYALGRFYEHIKQCDKARKTYEHIISDGHMGIWALKALVTN